jgi:hypothetical protein
MGGAVSPQKKHPALQEIKFIIFLSIFAGYFCSPGFGSNPEIDPQYRTSFEDFYPSCREFCCFNCCQFIISSTFWRGFLFASGSGIHCS